MRRGLGCVNRARAARLGAAGGMFGLAGAMRLVMVAFALLGPIAVSGGAQSAQWPGEWVSPAERDHPLAGRIYDVKAGAFISPTDYIAALSKATHVLLGEIHDNGDHHRLQGWVVSRLGGGARAVVFEQFRADQQSILNGFMAGLDAAGETTAAQVEKLFLATGWARSGWPEKGLYAPLMAAVVSARMAMLAGNPPRQRVMEVARQGLDAISADARGRLLLDRELGAALDEALLEELEASHCGLMPKSAFGNMAKAQRFRDGYMARVMADAAIGEQKSVLIAGNGHVRRDRGVPWYLARMAKAEDGGGIAVVGHVEVDPGRSRAADYSVAGTYDYIVFTPVAARKDPCEKMRARFKGRAKGR